MPSTGNFDAHTYTLAASATQQVILPYGNLYSGSAANTVGARYVAADGLAVSVVGASGDHCSIRIDTDTGDYFKVPTGTSIVLRVPIKKQLDIKNESDGEVIISIAFLRGRNHY